MEDNQHDLMRFSQIMTALAEDFGGTISKDGINLKYKALKNYDIKQIEKSATWLLKNREKDFPPVPRTKEFIDAIEEKHNKPDIQSIAIIEADIAVEALEQYGRNMIEIEFKNLITRYLMTKKWNYKKKANEILIEEFKWFRKDFIKSFIAISDDKEKIKSIEIENNNKIKQIDNNIYELTKNLTNQI